MMIMLVTDSQWLAWTCSEILREPLNTQAHENMSENTFFFSLQQKLCHANPVYTLLSSLKGLYDYKAILVTNFRISFLVYSSLVQPLDKKK